MHLVTTTKDFSPRPETKADLEEVRDKGGMIALLPRPEDVDKLHIEGGEDKDELHLTLAFLGSDLSLWSKDQKNALAESVRTTASYTNPVEGHVFAHARFNPDGDEPCAVYLVGQGEREDRGEAGLLSTLRQDLLGAILMEVGTVRPQHTPYVPHVTAGYGMDVNRLSYTGPIAFDRILLSIQGQQEITRLERTPYRLHTSDRAVPEDASASFNKEPLREVFKRLDISGQDTSAPEGLTDEDRAFIKFLTPLIDAEVKGALERVPGVQNWIDRLPAGLKKRWNKSIIYRAAVHMHEKGMPIGMAIASAINWAKHICKTGDVKQWKGPQKVRPKSRSECCGAVATWNAMRAHAKAN